MDDSFELEVQAIGRRLQRRAGQHPPRVYRGASGWLLRGVCRQPKIGALEIAEFNPAHDVDGRTARVVQFLLAAAPAPGARQLSECEDRYGANNVERADLDFAVAAIAATLAEVAHEMPRAA